MILWRQDLVKVQGDLQDKMKWDSAYNQGLTIKKSLNYIPGSGIDDQNKWVTVSYAVKHSGIDRSTFRKKIDDKEAIGCKINGVWCIRLKSFTKIIENYRYGTLRTRTGHWWTKQEKDILLSDFPIEYIMKLTNRSYRSIITKRSKLKNANQNPCK